MRQNTRKLIGIPLTFLYLVVYVLVAMAVGASLAVRDVSELTRFLYHAIAGFAWLPGAMLLIKWMSRPDAPPRDGARGDGR